MSALFITGIGTDVGKTVISSILVEKLGADYWKPIQSGDLENSDTMKVKALVSNPAVHFHPEAYRLNQPLSPHHSAKLDGVFIDSQKIKLPFGKNNNLVIEGAGGLMVPLNSEYMMIDLARDLGAEIILVSRAYLGSINHTLLSIEVIKQRGLPLRGIIFNGAQNIESEDVILEYSGIKCLGRIPEAVQLGQQFISGCGSLIEL